MAGGSVHCWGLQEATYSVHHQRTRKPTSTLWASQPDALEARGLPRPPLAGAGGRHVPSHSGPGHSGPFCIPPLTHPGGTARPPCLLRASYQRRSPRGSKSICPQVDVGPQWGCCRGMGTSILDMGVVVVWHQSPWLSPRTAAVTALPRGTSGRFVELGPCRRFLEEGSGEDVRLGLQERVDHSRGAVNRVPQGARNSFRRRKGTATVPSLFLCLCPGDSSRQALTWGAKSAPSLRMNSCLCSSYPLALELVKFHLAAMGRQADESNSFSPVAAFLRNSFHSS